MRVAIVAGAVLIGVNVLIWGGRAQVNGPAEVRRPIEIQQLFPREGDLALPQSMVGADLRDQFTGQITIDGTLIPKDQYDGIEVLGEVLFNPGENKEFEELPKGAHNAVIEWWPREIPTPEEARERQQLRSYSWAFNVG
jgi:hypothetical protein